MPHGGSSLDMQHEEISAVVADLAEFRSALDQVKSYAAADDLAAQHFGKLGDIVGVGGTFTGVRDTLRGSLDKLLPHVDQLVAALNAAVKTTTETDAEAAMNLGAVDGR
ncbi:hypothetical protein EV186_1011764 [Labedaea rhizosphaerae]|uniref:Excreted virulence factor EspC (Type VII ESX diderm) n=2 Tax=Labedaea rhizosphaerae TaxID=598644 RepID=A0A4R6SMN2_LABRH|nr:hypothetical protein EV186_1011764 [Labedaea rhizosphaerae]